MAALAHEQGAPAQLMCVYILALPLPARRALGKFLNLSLSFLVSKMGIAPKERALHEMDVYHLDCGDSFMSVCTC